MKRNSSLVLVLVLLLLSACGNLSNDDLLFLAGIPQAREVELVVDPNTVPTGHALVGDPAEMYESADEIAAAVNTGVGELLDLIDNLGTEFPPTERLDDARIWGPVPNADNSGLTYYLEIRRSTNDDRGPRFSFCLQVARDTEADHGTPGCPAGPDNTFHTVLSGHYDPRATDGGARSGSGTIRLDYEALHAVGTGTQNERGALELTYDFTGGGIAKQLHIEAVSPVTTATIPQTTSYDYGRSADGHVDFYFEINGQVSNDSDLDSLTVNATWTDGQGGRAAAIGFGGDLRADQHAVLTECWDGNNLRTYYYLAVFRGDQELVILKNEGEIESCPTF